MKAIEIQTSKKGEKYALCRKGSKYCVLVLCANYAGHVKGGIAYTWRLSNSGRAVAHGLDIDEAVALFNRRVS